MTSQSIYRASARTLIALVTISFSTASLSTNAPFGENLKGLGQISPRGGTDSDGDGVSDSVDNCTDVANPDQRDSDGDGHGNFCDGDLNNTCGIVNFGDYDLFRSVFFTIDADADLNGDGAVNGIDLSIFQGLFFLPPGPSAPGAFCNTMSHRYPQRGELSSSSLPGTNGNAANMSIMGPSDVVPDIPFELEIWGDFDGEGLIFGGIEFDWDPAVVNLDSVVLNLDAISDFSCPGSVNCLQDLAASTVIVWGEFLVDLIDASAGPTLMATLTFTAMDVGSAVFSMNDRTDFTGGWFGSGFNPIPIPTFINHEMHVDTDVDGDGVGDNNDNCQLIANPGQCDTNGDGFGNHCDADLDNNGIVNSLDLSLMRSSFGASGPNDADLDCNETVNTFDLSIMRQSFGNAPGPSGLVR